MDISNAIYTLSGAIIAAIIAGVFNAMISRDSLNQRSKEELIQSACSLAISEIEGRIELMKANPGNKNGFDSGQILIYYLAFVSVIAGNDLLNLNDDSVRRAFDKAKSLSKYSRRDE